MKSLINTITTTTAGLDTLPMRIGAGAIFASHGAQKLFGWFGGYGLEGTGQWLATVGFEPGYLMAVLAGGAEFFGGIALILGLLTRPAAFVAAFTMLMAITVHLGNGLFMSNNGYEFALTLLAATTALAIQGAGTISIDAQIYKRVSQ